MLFLSISEGDDPENRRPIIASTDERLIRAVLDHLAVRFGTQTPAGRTPGARSLRPVPPASRGPGDEREP
jgi:hypothetical protein